MEEMVKETGLFLVPGWMQSLWLSTLNLQHDTVLKLTDWVYFLWVGGVPRCQGVLFSKELQIHIWRPEQEVAKDPSGVTFKGLGASLSDFRHVYN